MEGEEGMGGGEEGEGEEGVGMVVEEEGEEGDLEEGGEAEEEEEEEGLNPISKWEMVTGPVLTQS